MAMAEPCYPVSDHLTKKEQEKNMFVLARNYSREVLKYIKHLDSCDIGDNSDSSDSRQEQYIVTVFISNRHYFEFSGPWVCAVSALVLEEI